jgi:hypothetical protein
MHKNIVILLVSPSLASGGAIAAGLRNCEQLEAIRIICRNSISERDGMVHWTKKPENREKLAKAAAKRARTGRKRGRRSMASTEAVRYGQSPT